MPKQTILVVDDEPVVLNLTVAILTRGGYDTVIAANGEDALAICEELNTELALIVSDVVMPGMGGRKLADCVSNMLKPIPIVLMSGYSRSSPLVTGLLDGKLDNCRFISKPFLPAQLLETVSDALGDPVSN